MERLTRRGVCVLLVVLLGGLCAAFAAPSKSPYLIRTFRQNGRQIDEWITPSPPPNRFKFRAPVVKTPPPNRSRGERCTSSGTPAASQRAISEREAVRQHRHTTPDAQPCVRPDRHEIP